MKIKNNIIRSHSKSRRQGAAAVEAALLLPMLFIVTFGAIDIAQYINLAQMVTQASREGGRIASRNATGSIDEVETALLDYFGNCFPNLSNEGLSAAVTFQIMNEDGREITDLAETVSGDPYSIEVTFDYEYVRWLNGLDYWDGTINISTTHFRRE